MQKESLEKMEVPKPLVLILLPPTHSCLNYIRFSFCLEKKYEFGSLFSFSLDLNF
jgi:hypothetical protein